MSLPQRVLLTEDFYLCAGRRAKPGRFGNLAFAMKKGNLGGQCSWIRAGKARKCGLFWVFACVPNPGKQSIWRQCPPSAGKQSTEKMRNRPVFSENSRRLWLSEIPCWKSLPANFDAAGKFFTDFPAARNAIPARVWAFSRQGKWLLENRRRLRERSWIFSSETATAFLSFSELEP